MSPTAIGIVLALGAAVALNAAYVIQHVGSSGLDAVDPRRPIRTMASLMRSRAWLLGTALGFTGWALHIGAMREAPLSLVQAFVAGGLALAAPIAAFALRRRLTRAEAEAIALMAVALLLLAIGLREAGAHAGFDATGLAAWVAGLAAAATVLCAVVRGPRRALALGVAGGLLYGAGDLAMKAVTGQTGAGHALASPWLAVALAATGGAFFAFQRGLQSDAPLVVIALMTAATNLSSIAGAFVVFGDPLGRTPPLAAVHGLAFALVVFAAWRLAPVALAPDDELLGQGDARRRRGVGEHRDGLGDRPRNRAAAAVGRLDHDLLVVAADERGLHAGVDPRRP